MTMSYQGRITSYLYVLGTCSAAHSLRMQCLYKWKGKHALEERSQQDPSLVGAQGLHHMLFAGKRKKPGLDFEGLKHKGDFNGGIQMART